MKPQWGTQVKDAADRISHLIGHVPSTRIGAA
jgi:hypothetical protein